MSREIKLFYTGKLISTNRRLLYNPRNKRNVPDPEYKKCSESMQFSFMSQTQIRGLKYVDIEILLRVNNRQDHHNLTKLIFDVLEKSGIILNDKYINDIHILKPIRSKDKENKLMIIVKWNVIIKEI